MEIKHLIDALTVNVSYTQGEMIRRHWNKECSSGKVGRSLARPPNYTGIAAGPGVGLFISESRCVHQHHDLLPRLTLE